MAYTVIGSLVSPFVRKVQIVLHEKGIDFEHEDVNPFTPPADYRETSPLGKIPALRHDDRVVNDSSVICRYLEQLHPSPALYPSDPYECARAEWIEEYADGGLQPVAGNGVFAPLVLRPMMTGSEPDEAGARKVIEEDLPVFFGYLEGQLGGSGHFVGDSLTIADIAIACPFANLRLAGVLPDAERFPKLRAFVKAMHGRPSSEAVIKPVRGLLGKRWVEID